MKKNLILAGLMITLGAANGQNNVPNGSGSGYVGIGTILPANELEVVTQQANGGVSIISPSGGTGGALLYLDNRQTGSTPGHKYSIGSLGAAAYPGDLSIFDWTTSRPVLHILGSNGNIGIGSLTPTNKFYVEAPNDLAIRGEGRYGVSGKGIGNTPYSGLAMGILGRAENAQSNYAGWFQTQSGPYGTLNFGVYAEVVNPTSGGSNYAVFGDVHMVNNTGTGLNWAGYFNGDVFTSASAYFSSDKNLKTDIRRINNSLDIISKLNPVMYKFDYAANSSINLPDENQYGFISQEIKEILPEFTKTVIHPAKLDKNGKEIYPSKEILGLNYQGFIALLTKGMQEQQGLIEQQNVKISDLQAQLDKVSNNKTENPTGINQLNSAADGFALDQNIPNPFSHETVINYRLPQQIKNASLIIYDLSGKQLTAFPLELNAKSISITSEKLAAGIYIYSVMADGKIMDSKRMVVADK